MSNNDIENSNCIISKQTIEQIKSEYKYDYVSNMDSVINIDVQFYNNPYLIDDRYNLGIILSGKTILYSGKFKRFLKTKIPQNAIGKMNSVKFIVSDANSSYIFSTETIGMIEKSDDLMQIVFIPHENDWFTFYFTFTKNGKSLEGP